MLDLDDQSTGQYVIEVSPDDVTVLPVPDAATICFWSARGARPLNALTGTYLGNPIALVPELNSGKICLSLFDNKSTEWLAAI